MGFRIIRVTLVLIITIRGVLIGVMRPVILAALLAIFPAPLMLVLLRLMAALLVSLFVKGRDEVLKGSDEVNAEISLGFMGFLDRFGDIFDGCRKAFERGINAFEARSDSFEKFHLRVVV